MEAKYYIDTRPLPLLFLIQYKGVFFLLALSLVFLKLMTLPNPFHGMTIQGYRALVIFGLAGILWITNILPLAITSLLVMGLLATYQVIDKNLIYGFFGDSAIFFIIGAFIIASAVSATGLSKRLAYLVLYRYGKTPHSVVTSIFLLSGFMSFFMPEHAVAAFLFPIVMQITRVLGLPRNSVFGKFNFFALAWGSVTGGVATFLGGARNPMAVGILRSETGLEITFLEWFVTVGPMVLILMGLIVLMLRFIRFEDLDLKNTGMCKLRERPGKITFNEIKALVLLVVTLYLWIFHGESLGIANIALISGAMYFVLNVVSWEELSREINWGTIFMYGGAITLGKSLSATGALDWFIVNYLSRWELSGFTVLMIASLLSLGLTNGISNAAVVGMLLPVILKYSLSIGMDPRIAAYTVAVPAGLSFMLPMGTPANAIAFSAGYYTVWESVRYGLVLNIISWIVFMVTALFYWPVTGLRILG